MSRTKTVAIIGGGVSGLAAGGWLARRGYRVKLFETNEKLGGCCASTCLNGYTFHDGALFLAFPGILDHVFAQLGLERTSLLPLRRITANQTTRLPDGTVVSFGDGREVTIQRPGEAVARPVQHELDALLAKWEPVRRLFAEDLLLHPVSLVRLATKGWRHLLKLRGTVAPELRRLIDDEALRAAVAGVMLYAGRPPQKIPIHAILGPVALFSEGFFLPEGGMGRIPEALSQALHTHGAEVHLNTRIERIAVRHGQVWAVDVGGQGLEEVDAVIVTTSGMHTANSLLDEADLPGRMRRRLQTTPLSHKALVIQLGLSNRVGVHNHFQSELPLLDDQGQALSPSDGEWKWPIYSVPTVTAPELAPPGGSIIELFPPVEQDLPADAWENARLERVVATAIAALSQRHTLEIVVQRVLSPKHFRDRLHLYRGAVYGLSPTAGLQAYFPHVTPLRGLFQAGQTTYPGYGVTPAAMSGLLAAEALAARL